MRLSDGWFLEDSFTEADETLRDQIKELKCLVDDYEKNPQEYEDDEN
jgi:hypothetical protein